MFGSVVRAVAVTRWMAGRKKQVIGQAELAPTLLAAHIWAKRLRGRFVVWWLDQDAARQALIKGYSPVYESASIVDEVALKLSWLSCYAWYARVPSPSNPADAASRLDWKTLYNNFPEAVQLRVPGELWQCC